VKIDIFLQQCNQTICEGVIAFFYVQHLPVQSVPITTRDVSLNPVDGEMYSIQHYVIKFVSGFLQVLRFPPPINLTAMI